MWNNLFELSSQHLNQGFKKPISGIVNVYFVVMESLKLKFPIVTWNDLEKWQVC